MHNFSPTKSREKTLDQWGEGGRYDFSEKYTPLDAEKKNYKKNYNFNLGH